MLTIAPPYLNKIFYLLSGNSIYGRFLSDRYGRIHLRSQIFYREHQLQSIQVCNLRPLGGSVTTVSTTLPLLNLRLCLTRSNRPSKSLSTHESYTLIRTPWASLRRSVRCAGTILCVCQTRICRKAWTPRPLHPQSARRFCLSRQECMTEVTQVAARRRLREDRGRQGKTKETRRQETSGEGR